MFEAIRVLPVSPKRRAISPDRMVKSAVARQTKRLVRIPAGRRRRSRSTPMTAPRAAATVNRRRISWRGSIAQAAHRPLARFYYLQFELRQFREVACPGVYLAAFQVAQPLQTELFDREAAKHRAVYHGAAQGRVTLVAGPGQIAHETPGKTVAGARGIVRLFEGKGRHTENAALVDHHGAVFSALHHQRRRAHLENAFRGTKQIVLVRKLASLRIVDHQD